MRSLAEMNRMITWLGNGEKEMIHKLNIIIERVNETFESMNAISYSEQVSKAQIGRLTHRISCFKGDINTLIRKISLIGDTIDVNTYKVHQLTKKINELENIIKDQQETIDVIKKYAVASARRDIIEAMEL